LNPTQALGLLTPDFRAGLDEESLYAPLMQTLTQLPGDVEPLNQML